MINRLLVGYFVHRFVVTFLLLSCTLNHPLSPTEVFVIGAGLTEVYRLTFFIGSVPAATRELLCNEAYPLPFPEPFRVVDRSVEQWTESLGAMEIRDALRAGLAAYVKNAR